MSSCATLDTKSTASCFHVIKVITSLPPKEIVHFTVSFLDSLVLHLQLIYDGHFLGGSGVHDSNENTKKGLCQIQQRGGNGWHGRFLKQFAESKSVNRFSVLGAVIFVLFEILKWYVSGGLFCPSHFTLCQCAPPGQRPGRWIRVEAGTWRCVSAVKQSTDLLFTNRLWLSDLFRLPHCHHRRYGWGSVHRVSNKQLSACL